MTVLGFTGTQRALTTAQAVSLAQHLGRAGTLHHGACIGADMLAHNLALLNGTPVVVHPPENESKVYRRAIDPTPKYRHLVTVLPPKDYRPRNHDIVAACDEMLALPRGVEKSLPRSGTWMTIRAAVKAGKPVTVVYPDGRTEVL